VVFSSCWQLFPLVIYFSVVLFFFHTHLQPHHYCGFFSYRVFFHNLINQTQTDSGFLNQKFSTINATVRKYLKFFEIKDSLIQTSAQFMNVLNSTATIFFRKYRFFFITVKTKCLQLKSSLCHGYWSSSDRQINNKSKHTLMYIFLSLVELMIILIKLSQSRVYTPSIASSPLNSLTPFFVRLIDSSGCSKEFIRFDAECSLSLSEIIQQIEMNLWASFIMK